MGFHAAVVGALHVTRILAPLPWVTEVSRTTVGDAVGLNTPRNLGICNMPLPQPVHCVPNDAAYSSADLMAAAVWAGFVDNGYLVLAIATAAATMGADIDVPCPYLYTSVAGSIAPELANIRIFLVLSAPSSPPGAERSAPVFEYVANVCSRVVAPTFMTPSHPPGTFLRASSPKSFPADATTTIPLAKALLIAF